MKPSVPLLFLLVAAFLAACQTAPASDPLSPPLVPPAMQCIGDTSRIELPALPRTATTGWVQVEYALDNSGKVQSISIQGSSPAKMYDALVVKLLQERRFKQSPSRKCEDVFVFKVNQ